MVIHNLFRKVRFKCVSTAAIARIIMVGAIQTARIQAVLQLPQERL
jgi:hypothetical protein